MIFTKKNLHHNFQPSSLMDQLSNPLDITSTNNHITQIYDKNSSNIVGKCGFFWPLKASMIAIR
jgi:hypothetical protein